MHGYRSEFPAAEPLDVEPDTQRIDDLRPVASRRSEVEHYMAAIESIKEAIESCREGSDSWHHCHRAINLINRGKRQ